MSDKEFYTQLVVRLVDYFGDYSTVAAVLNVHERALREWSEGKTAPPLEFVRGAINLADELAVSEAQHGSTTARAAWNTSYSRRSIDAPEL
jgi:hypothetical protein